MKTISDLENMKRQKCLPFENAYDYLMMTLEDFYVAKSEMCIRDRCRPSYLPDGLAV